LRFRKPACDQGPQALTLPDRLSPRDTVGKPLQENTMTEFLVEGMSCGHCVNAVTAAIHSLDPAASVDVNLGTKLVRIDSDLDRFLLSQALVDAGYDPVLVGLQMPDHI
jgi:copper chaperone